ncbi:hypothetical protein PT285_01015 [Lactobacillus sp. ESL0791]|uniref:hypothetical protein n=1 Tax=Lactobacillus sp. ESL0791 TaxID=2983234 RepID=UPI0023F8A703|nr:hypothetical protein [Lactobacillus sp. ESL0791]MDF7638019.1 hypothetical protein [Lactobacillus sp. ESL0791]
MKTNDVITLYVGYIEGKGGKRRPVIVRKISNQGLMAFKVTTKYANKSEYIKQQYYSVHDWAEAGLKQQSWIDIGNIYEFKNKNLQVKKIGHLTAKDQIGLARFNTEFKLKRKYKK